MPVSPIIITQPYWSDHPAIDIDTYYREPIFAYDSGNVSFSGWDTTGYRNMVIIDHGIGQWTYYTHDSFNLLAAGQGVPQGQVAESSSTVYSTGDHSGFRIKVDGGSSLNKGELPSVNNIRCFLMSSIWQFCLWNYFLA